MISRRDMMAAGLAAGLAISPLRAAVRFDGRGRGFRLAAGGVPVPLHVDAGDWPGVARAARDLAADIGRVTGTDAAFAPRPSGRRIVLIGTLGRSATIDALAAAGKIDVAAIRGKWESYTLQTIANPMPGVAEALVIAGSDKRGTIYGIYDLSQNIGVSPWYWWADVPVVRRVDVSVAYGRYVQGEPAVRYRGIFLNNEAPCLSGWTAEKFGGMGADFYTKVFELLLRLRANYLWPAMWNNAFYTDDPRNGALAEDYGIVMGTSHHEPMNRAHKEWTSHRGDYGNGDWNYVTNADGVQRFFREGARRSRDHELVVTMGMRGDGDVALEGTGSLASDIALLERVIADQRRILGEETGRPVETIPQVWVVFTEVQKYYEGGLKLPDDVTLMFSDDNVGYIRRLPNARERRRKGGTGVYYHMDMNGGPYSYKWVNTVPFPKIWEQMNLALEYGADRIWIANIGDLKPLELPIEFFLAMAWDPKAVADIGGWTRRWAAREFGADHAEAIAGFVSRYAKYNSWRKPEQLRVDTFSLDHFREAERVAALWADLRREAEAVATAMRPGQAAAYYQFVLHPIRGCANLNHMLLAAARNARFAQQGRASTNAEAAEVRRLFAESRAIRDYYNHDLSGGKWNHLMDQTYIGYYDWYQPPVDAPPAVTEIDIPDAGFGVAVEGMRQAWPGYYLPPQLPVFDSLSRLTSHIEVFARGRQAIDPQVRADAPWIVLTPAKAFSIAPGDRRFEVTIDWAKLPPGRHQGQVTVRQGGEAVRAQIVAIRASAEQERAAKGAWGALAGPFAVPADGYVRNRPAAGVTWRPIPDYGRVRTAMTPMPVDAPSFADPKAAARMEYDLFLPEAGEWHIDLVTAPTLQVQADRMLSLAMWLDDGPPQVVSVFTPENRVAEEFLGRAYSVNARDDARILRFTTRAAAPGRRRLTIAMIDPTIVVERIHVYRDTLPPTHFGPPESRIA